jgi:hypothetical protein
MKSFLRFFTYGILGLFIHHHINAQTGITPFTSTSPNFHSGNFHKPQPIKIISFQGNRTNNKVLMQWVINQNETANEFEVEKSMDGKKFSMIALVFGTDKPETETYMFYEKSSSKKVSYRIKCIDKYNNVSYSDILTVNPTANNN